MCAASHIATYRMETAGMDFHMVFVFMTDFMGCSGGRINSAAIRRTPRQSTKKSVTPKLLKQLVIYFDYGHACHLIATLGTVKVVTVDAHQGQ